MGNWFSEPMKDEIPFSEIEKKSEEFHHWNFEPFSMQEIGYEGVMDELKEYTAERYEALDDEGKERLVDEVLAIYRSVDLLPIQYYSELGVMNEIEKCISYKAGFDGDTVSCGAGIGTTLCNYLFPNIFDTPSKHDLDKKDAETLFKKFHNDQYLKRAIKFCFSYKNGCPTPTNVMGGLRLVGSAPTNFRPMNAKAIYERFCPEGGTVYDFCCVDGDTEFFSEEGWKKISEYQNGDKVLQYNESGTAELVNPMEYIHYKSSDPFYEYNKGLLNTCLTGNHDVVLRGSDGELYKKKMSAVLSEKDSNSIPLVFRYKKEGSQLGKEIAKAYFPFMLDAVRYGYPCNEQGVRVEYSVIENNKVLRDLVLRDKNIEAFMKEAIAPKDLFAKWSEEERQAFYDAMSKDEANGDESYTNIKNLVGFVTHMTYEEAKDYYECLVKHGNHVDLAVDFYDIDYDSEVYVKSDVLCKYLKVEGGFVVDFTKEIFKLGGDDLKVLFECIKNATDDLGGVSKTLVLDEKNKILRDMAQLLYTGSGSICMSTDMCHEYLEDTMDEEDFEFGVFYPCDDFDESSSLSVIDIDVNSSSYSFEDDDFVEVQKEDKYCFVVPSHMLVLRRGGKIFITGNCGFGGRLLGCLSSKKNFRYVGTDPCTETMYHLHELGDYIEMVTGREDSFELHCCGSEEFRGPAESVDFAFSSPPYFDLEVYSNEETQCFNKFPVLEDWLEGYVRATIKNIYHMLKRGAVYAVNIADFTVGGSKTVAYVDEWIRISTEEGMPLYDTVYLGVTARAGSAQQAAGELKKENILIFKKPL